jgi:hypothetical protein
MGESEMPYKVCGRFPISVRKPGPSFENNQLCVRILFVGAEACRHRSPDPSALEISAGTVDAILVWIANNPEVQFGHGSGDCIAPIAALRHIGITKSLHQHDPGFGDTDGIHPPSAPA